MPGVQATCVSSVLSLKREKSLYLVMWAEPHSSVVSVADLRTGNIWFDPRLGQYFFPRIDDIHCDRI